MGIRPFVAIQQDLEAGAPNVLESTMKGMLVGPAVQDEQEFTDNVNLSTTYGTLGSILTDIATTPKTVTTAGLISGATLQFDTLRFGATEALSTIDFGSDTYTGKVDDLAEKWLITLDTGAGTVGKTELLEKGAQAGDAIDISFDDGTGTVVTERHKIRDFIEDAGTGDITLRLWSEVANAGLETTTEITVVHYKQFAKVNLDILAPLTADRYSNSNSDYVLDNTVNSTDGGFSTDYYVYSPVSAAEGVTFDNILVKTEKDATLSSYTETKVTVKVTDGKLLNFFTANRADLSNNVFEVTTSDYVKKLGTPSLKNKLSYAMQLIAQEIPGATMKVYVTEDDTEASYTKAFSSIVSQENVYSVTPLSDDSNIVNGTISMATMAASSLVAKYKMAVIGPRTAYFVEKISTNNFTVELVSGDIFKVTLTNGGMLSQGAKVGDYLFSTATKSKAEEEYYLNTNETYSQNSIATVEQILTDNQFTARVATSGFDLVAALTDYLKIGSINKNTDLINILTARTKSIASKNVVSLFPDKFEMSVDDKETIIPGYFVASIVNAVMAHLPPQQGLSNLSFNSISKVYGSSFMFSDSELDEIAEAGNFVLLQQNFATSPYALRQLTTDTSSLETMEINKVRCLDYATLAFASVLDNYIGKRNINDSNLEEISIKLENTGKVLISSTKNDILGSVITSYKVSDVVIPQGEKDAVNAYVDVETPTSMNKIRLFISSGKN